MKAKLSHKDESPDQHYVIFMLLSKREAAIINCQSKHSENESTRGQAGGCKRLSDKLMRSD